MNKLIIVIIALLLLAVGLYFWLQLPASSPYGEQPLAQPTTSNPTLSQPSDATPAINEELDRVDLGDLDKEFEEVDRDLQGL